MLRMNCVTCQDHTFPILCHLCARNGAGREIKTPTSSSASAKDDSESILSRKTGNPEAKPQSQSGAP